jgi:hypothetical protein
MSTVFIDTGSSFNPTDFRNSFKDGIGRPSLFVFKIKRYPQVYYKKKNTTGIGGALSAIGISDQVINTGTALFETIKGRGLQDLQFRVTKFSLPSKNIETYTTKTYGPSTEFPREIENSSMTINVLCSGAYFEHEFFQSWADTITGYHGKMKNSASSSKAYGFDVEYYDDVISEAELVVYNEDGGVTYLVKFDDIYPKSVGGIEFDWNAKNEMSEFSVTLNYRTMVSEKIAFSAKIGGAVGSVLNAASSFSGLYSGGGTSTVNSTPIRYYTGPDTPSESSQHTV